MHEFDLEQKRKHWTLFLLTHHVSSLPTNLSVLFGTYLFPVPPVLCVADGLLVNSSIGNGNNGSFLRLDTTAF